jgi:pilus assembly protein CpaF
VAGCLDLVVHTATDHEGRRRIREICALPGRVEDGVIEIADIFVDRGRDSAGNGFPPHQDRFERAGYDLGRLLEQGHGPTAAVRTGWAA